MITNLILGAIAGFLTPMAEPYIRKAMSQLALSDIPVGETEFDVLSLLTMLIAASILVGVLGANSMAFPLLLGALGGLFGKRFIAAVKGTAMGSKSAETASEAAADDMSGEGEK